MIKATVALGRNWLSPTQAGLAAQIEYKGGAAHGGWQMVAVTGSGEPAVRAVGKWVEEDQGEVSSLFWGWSGGKSHRCGCPKWRALALEEHWCVRESVGGCWRPSDGSGRR
jgi:hypothetical protein